jgi:glucose-6-phosphate isomerase
MNTTAKELANERIRVDWATGQLHGADVRVRVKTLREIAGLFNDAYCCGQMDPETVVYRVQWWEPVPEGTEGGLFWGRTVIEPGKVGDEYFMTHGHFHLRRDRAEIYGAVQGNGALILADATGRTWMEPMSQGSLHYIAGDVAHRVANVGEVPLSFLACWGSDAGHEYGTIATSGFGARLICHKGTPTLLRVGDSL